MSRQTRWTADFCSCCMSPSTCCITLCLPCITFGQIAEMLEEGQTSCITLGCLYGLLATIGCQWIYSCTYREKLRAKYGLPSEPCGDCCVHFCCGACALCQEYNELRNRGLDPSKGWIGPPKAAPQNPPSMRR